MTALGPITLGYRYPAVDEAIRTPLPDRTVIAAFFERLEAEFRALLEGSVTGLCP